MSCFDGQDAYPVHCAICCWERSPAGASGDLKRLLAARSRVQLRVGVVTLQKEMGDSGRGKEPQRPGLHDGLAPVADVELLEDVGEVFAHGQWGDDQSLGDFLV